MALKASKPKSPKYPKKLKTLGDHIRKKRLDLGLFQRDVADQIGVSEATIYNWERNTNSPQVHDIPAVIRFLGYNPLPSSSSFPEQLRYKRRLLGLSQTGMAKRVGVDPTTFRKWDQGRARPTRRSVEIIQKLIHGEF